MKFRRTHVFAVAAVASLSLGVAACGSEGPSGSSGTDAAVSADAATMWGLTGGATETVIKESISSWNPAHSDQQIKVDWFANDAYKTKVRTAMGAGQGPTIVWSWGGGTLADYVKSGQVDDMTSFVQSNPALAKKFLPAVLKSGQVDGKTYALPNNNVQPVILYFNKDALAKAGVQAPKTWDELLAVIPKLNAAGVAPLSIGGQSKWPELMWLEYLTDRVGGPEVFNNIIAGKPTAWSDPAVIQALTMIQQLVDAGGFVKGFSSIAADSNADQALLFTGKAAMLLQGGWIYSTLKTNAAAFVSSGKLGYTTFPTVTGGKGDPANVVGNPANFWSISSKATDAQKKTAQSYLADGMFTDSYIDTLIKAGTVPVVQGIESKLEAAGSDKDFLVSEYNMVKNAPGFQLSWDQALSPGTADTMLSNLDQIFLKKISPQQFADTMNATLGK